MNLPVIAFNEEVLSRFNEALQREWLVTNGLGGYASSTALGINTRKYHGLLVAALNPPGDRTVCLSKLDEDIIVGDEVYRLGTNEFQNMVYPQGYTLLKSFSVSPFPTYTYRFGGVTVDKTIFMPKNKNAVSVVYKITNQNTLDAQVRVYPLLTCRPFHQVLNQWKTPLAFTQKSSSTQVEIAIQQPKAAIQCRITDGEFKEKINWVDDLLYRLEALRGEESLDDCFQPGRFELQVPGQQAKEFAVITAAGSEAESVKEILDTVGVTIDQVKVSYGRELEQQTILLNGFYGLNFKVPVNEWLCWVLLAANSFIVQNCLGKKSVIAGYHWFEPWGRDTFISLPGLMLVTGRYSGAKDILENFIGFCKNGLIPNFLSDKPAQPAYNTVDATLWYVNAVLQYLKYTGDYAFVEEQLWEDLKAIVSFHEEGTMFGIRVDYDGLLMHGSRLTWMDAKVGDREITPRIGKAVEIQALWYNTLRIMQLLASKFGDIGLNGKYGEMANVAKQSFNEKFWNPKLGCLYDVLGHDALDASLRPNQIFAVSLDFPILDSSKSKQVVEVVNRELVTPYGLRTLSFNDPKFVGKCYGDQASRDTAYHNGTIWPWLIGPFSTAYLKVNDYSAEAREYIQNSLIFPLISKGITQMGLGTLCEIYDCDEPNPPRGCISQAWSVAEPLRAYIEDVLGVKPNHLEDMGT